MKLKLREVLLSCCRLQDRAVTVVCLAGIMSALPCYSESPKIKSIGKITTQQYQTIVIKGGDFGAQQPYTGDSAYISLLDTTKVWQAGFVGYLSGSYCGGPGSGDDAVTLIVNSWTDSKITLGGFSGAWGESDWTLNRGDVIHVCVWNPQSGDGPAEVATRVVQEATTITLSSHLNSPAPGQVTFTAVVASNLGAPPNGEPVSFMEGETLLGAATLRDGTASFTTSMLEVGSHSITAVYDGDPDFGDSTSTVLRRVVDEAAN